MKLTLYLSGEIHSNWRQEILDGITEARLPIEVLTPVTDHAASDDIGADILGSEENAFWHDHKSAKINTIRIRTAIERADVVIVKFGEKYKQWNAAFDAGYAVAKNKPLIVLHGEEQTHALKEINASALVSARTTSQLIEVLRYISAKK